MKWYSKVVCVLLDLILDNLYLNEVVEILELKNDLVLVFVISCVIYLKEVFLFIDNMCIIWDFNIYEFFFVNKRSLINVIWIEFVRLKEEDCLLESDMNNECFWWNLVLFGFIVDFVLGNGDCCFNSIVK